jgi:S-(hydroxymethyl)glutathione dehydrogenase / alcohol dehydrogenase
MMKAAVLEVINEPLVVGEVDLTDLKFGQVLVKISISGVCGAQLQEIAGLKNNAKFVPHLVGHEGCGIVEKIGEGVTRVKPSDKVILHWKKGEGIESPFPEYVYKSKKISSGKITTLSEYSVISENRMTVVPKETPDEFCALLGCGLSTALGTINYDANIKFGESLLVLGCGGVGLNMILCSDMAGAGSIYGIDLTEEKRPLVEALRAKYINLKQDDSIIKEKLDCIIDTTGNMQLVSDYLPLLSSRGRCIIVSQPNMNNSIQIKNPTNFFAGDGQIIRSTQGGNVNPSEDFPRYVSLYKKHPFDLSRLITHRFGLGDVNTALDLMRNGKAGRVIITF